MELQRHIRDIPDFPKKGVVFKDITPLLAHPGALAAAVDDLTAPYASSGVQVVAGIESRGFIFAALVAHRLGAGFVPIRKPGKLPYKTLRESYQLEYGSDAVEIHTDAIAKGQTVLMVDDLLATGGTMSAACKLVRKLGGKIVGVAFVIELCFLHGRDKLKEYPLHTLIQVAAE